MTASHDTYMSPAEGRPPTQRALRATHGRHSNPTATRTGPRHIVLITSNVFRQSRRPHLSDTTTGGDILLRSARSRSGPTRSTERVLPVQPFTSPDQLHLTQAHLRSIQTHTVIHTHKQRRQSNHGHIWVRQPRYSDWPDVFTATPDCSK